MLNSELDPLIQKGRRKKLVEELAKCKMFGSRVLRAIGAVPRHIFIEKGMEEFAYKNIRVEIGEKQTISQPSTVALETELLDVKSGDKILEIGTGCGYQTAILFYLGANVYSIERQKELFLQAQINLQKIEYTKPKLFWGDGFKGLPQFAPFDGIIVTCGAPEIPNSLLLQLKIGGRIVIPVGEKEQEMLLITRKNKIDFEKKSFGAASFVPMLHGVKK
ncbi:MAG: protein-L-isoaspartate(D-aspartate) O-methyltransferase [Bacteroidales bacterium]|jgi:protein-L-isoaspartate(D-aspartate) O-methyltransferase|nr:protein-L-isoaspartate(D-aspartate) O-methyltransferase [Bacteroidales bacterium]